MLNYNILILQLFKLNVTQKKSSSTNIEEVHDSDGGSSAASMSEEEDDGGDILKEFLSTHGRDNFIPPKRTRKIRLENSVIKEPNKNKKKGETYIISSFII